MFTFLKYKFNWQMSYSTLLKSVINCKLTTFNL